MQLAATVSKSVNTVDVKAIRRKMGMSQTEFAGKFSIALRTLQDWEQGRRSPDRSVRAYLTVIEHEPQAVSRALAGVPEVDMTAQAALES